MTYDSGRPDSPAFGGDEYDFTDYPQTHECMGCTERLTSEDADVVKCPECSEWHHKECGPCPVCAEDSK